MKTGLLRRVAVVAAFSGVTIALPVGAASADRVAQDIAYCQGASGDRSDLSPSTRVAWANFICGGGHTAGGLARMVSGAWIGAPGTVIAGATGTPMTPEQRQAWVDWNEGAREAGEGAAMIVSGVYVGAPGYIVDKIVAGATPAELTSTELEQVTFLLPADSAMAESLPATGAAWSPATLFGTI